MKKSLNRRQLRKLLLREMKLITEQEDKNATIDQLRQIVSRMDYNGDDKEIEASIVQIQNVLNNILNKLERIKGA
jgi:hypothetical protein